MHDIAPHSLVSGTVETTDLAPEAERELAARLRAFLAERRYLGALRDAPLPERAGGAEPCSPDCINVEYRELALTLVCDAQQRLVRAGDHGEPVAGALVEAAAEELTRELGIEVTLVAEDLDEEYTEDDEEDLDDEDDTLDFDDEDDTLDFDDEDDDLDDDDDCTCEPDGVEGRPDLVAVFSRRAVSSGAFVALLGREPVDAGRTADWSAIRYADEAYLDLPAATRRELPSIEVRVDGDDGTTMIEVATRAARGMDAHLLCTDDAEGRRPLVDPAGLRADAARLQELAVDPHLAPDSTVADLIADPGLRIDVPALLAACAAAFTGSRLERAEAVLVALGVPAELAGPALRDAELPESRRFEVGVLDNLQALAEDGLAGLRPIGAEPTLIGRVDDALHARPALGRAVSVAEAAAGAALIAGAAAGRRTRRRRGPRGLRALGIVGGAVLIADAAMDLLIAARRRR